MMNWGRPRRLGGELRPATTKQNDVVEDSWADGGKRKKETRHNLKLLALRAERQKFMRMPVSLFFETRGSFVRKPAALPSGSRRVKVGAGRRVLAMVSRWATHGRYILDCYVRRGSQSKLPACTQSKE
ncbi:unnamed protein product [Prorocentrum cordatum]|uniref:Uncharacterized protein n=1 Tax=Prorocentrum cordatum TaxID=2364126 RepID=A0ABN9WTE1_9DINO|nr:unnamed protein product [Polarella glacialis]